MERDDIARRAAGSDFTADIVNIVIGHREAAPAHRLIEHQGDRRAGAAGEVSALQDRRGHGRRRHNAVEPVIYYGQSAIRHIFITDSGEMAANVARNGQRIEDIHLRIQQWQGALHITQLVAFWPHRARFRHHLEDDVASKIWIVLFPSG